VDVRAERPVAVVVAVHVERRPRRHRLVLFVLDVDLVGDLNAHALVRARRRLKDVDAELEELAAADEGALGQRELHLEREVVRLRGARNRHRLL
jgi:hypothetical protein